MALQDWVLHLRLPLPDTLIFPWLHSWSSRASSDCWPVSTSLQTMFTCHSCSRCCKRKGNCSECSQSYKCASYIPTLALFQFCVLNSVIYLKNDKVPYSLKDVNPGALKIIYFIVCLDISISFLTMHKIQTYLFKALDWITSTAFFFCSFMFSDWQDKRCTIYYGVYQKAWWAWFQKTNQATIQKKIIWVIIYLSLFHLG